VTAAATAELRELLDRERIRERVARLARGEDRRDAELVRAAFWPDATVDFGMFAGDFAAYLDWVVPGSPAVPLTQHVLGQSVIELRGDTALVETHVLGYHRVDSGEQERDVVLAGRYLDRFSRRDDEWRIVERTMVFDWTQDLGVAVDWSQGLMGAPLRGDHSTGRAAGDHSVAFFAR
jgi:hypothetical protein